MNMSRFKTWIAGLKKKYHEWRFVEEEVPEPRLEKRIQDLRDQSIEIKRKIRLLEMFNHHEEAALRRFELFEVDKKLYALQKTLRKNAA